MKTITILGASGHGRVVADIARLNGYDEILFLDDAEKEKCGSYDVIGKCSQALCMDTDIAIAIGNPDHRRAWFERLKEKNKPILIHPNAVIGEDVTIGEGTVIMAGAVLNPGCRVGKACIVNTCSSVDHDCILGDYVHISVGAHLAGTVQIDDGTWVGAGATISCNIHVVRDCLIGTGAVVVKDLTESGKYIGLPARLMES